MPLINKSFSGKLNFDDQYFRVNPNDYVDALNISRDAEEDWQDVVVTNIRGNRSVSFTLPSGINKTIGRFEDVTRNKIYIFRWNSNNYDTISYYDKTTGVIVKVFENLTDSNNVDITGFDPSWKINHIDIIYDEENGDIIYWTDGLNPPSYMNVERATSGGYGTFLRSFIDVAKEPPSIPIHAVYEDDATVTVNNVRKRLWKFKERYWFDDNDKSVTSSQSEVPLPINPSDTDIDSNPTKNARIALSFPTGAANVKKIELFAAYSLPSGWSYFYLITTLDKAALSIPDNDIYIYRFYNDKAFTPLDVIESNQPFDLVPQKAYTQAFPNGNVPVYAAITEGYDRLTSLGNTVATPSSETNRRTVPKILLFAAQNGQSIGTAGGNIHIVVAGTVTTGDVFNIYTTGNTITYTAIALDTTTSVINGLRANALSQGFTSVSNDANNLVINKSAQQLLRYLLTPATAVLGASDTTFVYDWWDINDYGVVYFDEKGRTNGVETKGELTVKMSAYSETTGTVNIPKVTISIYHQPPDWAHDYQLVRTKNLRKSKLIQWMSDRTFKDTVVGADGRLYAYISIESLNQFVRDNPASSFLTYSFTPGDRIRFIKAYPTGLFAIPIILTDKDFEIVGSVDNPIINGSLYDGQFIKIILPDTDVSFNFGMPAHDYSNYYIELYTPSVPAADTLNVYYEFGEMYAIGNPTLSTRFHQGMTQNQSTNYVTPATFTLDKGGYYLRTRTINAAPEFKYTLTEQDSISSGAYIAMTLEKSYNAVGYIAKDIIPGYIAGNLFGDPNWGINVTDGKAYTFTVRGNIVVQALNDGSSPFKIRLAINDGVSNDVSIDLVPNTNAVANQIYTFAIDTTATFPLTYEKMYIYLFSSDTALDIKIISGNLTFNDAARKFTQLIIDPNFSDDFESAVNSNGRSWAIEPNAKQIYNPVLIRFGGAFENGTVINQTNRFYEDNLDEYDRSFGDIRKLFMEGRYLYVFQRFDVGVVPVLTQIVKDVQGNPLEANSDQLLNKINYPFKGKFGIGDVPESFAYGKSAKYFIDSNKGVAIRLSQDGITVLSVLYKTNSFFIQNVAAYNKNLNNGYAASGQPYTGDPTIYGVFSAYTNKYIIAFEEINRYDVSGNLIFHQDAYTIAFNETRNESEGFESLYSFHPEMMACLNNLLVSFKDGVLWKHDNPVYCNFFGVQYDAYIKGVFNDGALVKKTFTVITEESNVIWECPEIESNVMSYGNTPQQSRLIPQHFRLLEGNWHSALYRDLNSSGGLYNGNTLKGNYLIIKFQITDASEFSYLNIVSIKFMLSYQTTH